MTDGVATIPSAIMTPTGVERVPPHSDEAEISVLGGMLLEETAADRAMEILDREDFYHPAHRRIFAAIGDLRDQGHAPDALAVREELNRVGALEEVGGEEYLARIVEIVPTAANIDYHARLVLDSAVKRRLILAGTDIATEAYRSTDRSDQLLNRAEERIFRLSEHRFKKSFTAIGQLLQGALMQLESLSSQKEAITGVATGFRDLDEFTAGLQLSDLIIVAGRPSMGKTSLALNIAAHAAIVEDLPVAVFSLEMSMEQLVQRLISTEGGVSLKTLRTGQASSEQWKNVADACERLRRAAIYIDDSGLLNVLEMRAHRNGDRRLPPAHGERDTRRESPAGDHRDQPIPQGAVQGAQHPGRRVVAAFAWARAPCGPATAIGGSQGERVAGAGCRRGDLPLPRRVLPSRHREAGNRGSDCGQKPQRAHRVG